MRRTTLLLLCTTMLSALAVAVPASAAAPAWPATYRGLTDPQLLPIEIGIDELRDGRLGLSYVDLNTELTCPSGDRVSWGIGMGWWRPRPLDGKVTRIDEVAGNMALHVSLRVTPHRVRGTLSLALAAFDARERLQRCDSGSQRFTAERVPLDATAPASARPDVRLRVIDRGASVRVTHREARARDEGQRWYSGGFGRRLPIEFSVSDYGTRDAVVDNLGFGSELLCDSGDTYGEWYFFISWWGGGIDVSDHRGRFDEVSLDYALHWRARIAPGHAHGTLILATPAFTPDEELTRCASSHPEWTAEHVDEPQLF